MRHISFSLTTDQIRNQTKTVTRRLGWRTLKPGDLLQACEKCMGRRPGEPLVKLAVIRVVSVRREQLDQIDQPDCNREGFPHLTPGQFIEMFCRHMKVFETTEVTRIEFEYVPQRSLCPHSGDRFVSPGGKDCLTVVTTAAATVSVAHGTPGQLQSETWTHEVFLKLAKQSLAAGAQFTPGEHLVVPVVGSFSAYHRWLERKSFSPKQFYLVDRFERAAGLRPGGTLSDLAVEFLTAPADAIEALQQRGFIVIPSLDFRRPATS